MVAPCNRGQGWYAALDLGPSRWRCIQPFSTPGQPRRANSGNSRRSEARGRHRQLLGDKSSLWRSRFGSRHVSLLQYWDTRPDHARRRRPNCSASRYAAPLRPINRGPQVVQNTSGQIVMMAPKSMFGQIRWRRVEPVLCRDKVGEVQVAFVVKKLA